jgi:hypothetical protein
MTKSQLSGSNKNLALGPRRGLTPRLTGQLTVGHNVTLIVLRKTVQSNSETVVRGDLTVGSHWVAMPSEDGKDLALAIVKCKVHKQVKQL